MSSYLASTNILTNLSTNIQSINLKPKNNDSNSSDSEDAEHDEEEKKTNVSVKDKSEN
jgi:hypothetical protein